jgi:hypothetical protein
MNSPARFAKSAGADEGLSQGELFEPLPFSPKRPKPATLASEALAMLLAGRTLTHLGFLRDTGSWRCAAYVENLRKLGWPVRTVEVSAPSATNPRRAIAQYEMPSWVRLVVGGGNAQ